MKKIIIAVFTLLCLAIVIQVSFFFGLFGKFNLVCLPKYVHTEEYDFDNVSFVNPKDVSLLSIGDYNGFLKMYYSLKYFENLNDFDFEFYPKKIKNVDFLENFPDLEMVHIGGNSNDWSGISLCKNINNLYIHDSNFSNFNYLKDMHNIRYLDIYTSSELIYSDEADFSSATVINIKAPLIDISDIRTAVNVTGMGLDAKKISGFDTLKNMKSLESLRLLEADIDEGSLAIVLESDSIKRLSFLRCNFSISEEQVNEALKGFYERKVEVTLDECVFSE